MQCPIDGETLVISERSGVEIDYCPKCRGVWLDRGELDKILDKASNEYVASHEYDDRERRDMRSVKPDRDYDKHRNDRDYRDDRYYDKSYHGHKKTKKKSFLSEIFEFGD